jgi:hypothetical protein
MQELRVIGVEDEFLVLGTDDGARFRVALDEVVHARLRHTTTDAGNARKIAPKDIQAHIRSGMSAQDVAAITGAPLDYIQRFEGPVLAEREFVVQSALDVPVRTAADTDPLAQPITFGVAIRERLAALGGQGERWASWKEPGGSWIVKLAFTADSIDHDARWQFDPRKHALVPLNSEAVTLSQQGESAGPLIPRLRAVAPTAPVPESPARFDSGAFAIDASSPSLTAEDESAPAPAAVRLPTATEAEAEPIVGNQTADLLEALRRRRGEREAAPINDEDARAAHPSTGGIRIVEVPMSAPPTDDSAEAPATSPRATAPQPTARKKGRASMPSWDEIVFGARPDDDLA